MINIFESATKIVLLSLSAALIAIAIYFAVVEREVIDIFAYAVTAVLSFYFGQKTNIPLK